MTGFTEKETVINKRSIIMEYGHIMKYDGHIMKYHGMSWTSKCLTRTKVAVNLANHAAPDTSTFARQDDLNCTHRQSRVLLMWCSGRWNRMQGAPFALFTALLYPSVLFRTWNGHPICSRNVSDTSFGIRSDLPCQSMSIHLNPFFFSEVWSSVLRPVSVRPAAMA